MIKNFLTKILEFLHENITLYQKHEGGYKNDFRRKELYLWFAFD